MAKVTKLIVIGAEVSKEDRALVEENGF